MTQRTNLRGGATLGLIAILAVIAAYQLDLIGHVAYAVEKGRIKADREALTEVSSRDISLLESMSNAFNVVAEVVKPSVVNIRTTSKLEGASWTRRLRSVPWGGTNHPPITGAGSGVIFDERGHIVTNNHVVDNADRIEVSLSDGRRFRASVVGTDRMTDLAVIKIDADRLHPAKFGDSDKAAVGHLVLAVGSPFRFDQSVSQGIISAKGRSGVGVDIEYQDFIQTDAPINPGNSGGPLVNIRGEVIGITTAIATENGGYQGVGFAIPSNKAHRIASKLITGRPIVRGYLGVKIENLDYDAAVAIGLDKPRGAKIRGLEEDGPAKAAGLMPDDVIVSVNGRPIESSTDLQECVASLEPSSKAKFEIIRNSQRKTLTVTIQRQPENFALRSGRWAPWRDEGDDELYELPDDVLHFSSLGFGAVTLSPQLAGRFRIRDTQNGAVIVTIDPAGDAYAAGLRVGDVVTAVNKRKINNASELEQVLTPEVLRQGVQIQVHDSDGTRHVGLKIQN